MIDVLREVSFVRGSVDGVALAVLFIPARATCELHLQHDTAGLRRFFVDQNHRRQGLGTALFKAAVEEARSQGKLAMCWTVQKKNFGAVEFYQKQGARVVSDDETDWWMAIDLQGPVATNDEKGDGRG